jgi:hypothetical protein
VRYIFIYKCRNCGSRWNTGAERKEDYLPNEWHRCGETILGFSDLIACEVLEEKEC